MNTGGAPSLEQQWQDGVSVDTPSHSSRPLEHKQSSHTNLENLTFVQDDDEPSLEEGGRSGKAAALPRAAPPAVAAAQKQKQKQNTFDEDRAVRNLRSHSWDYVDDGERTWSHKVGGRAGGWAGG